MRIKDLKIILNQYNDNDLIFIELGIGTCLRIEREIIHPSEVDDIMYEIKNVEKHQTTNSLILKIE